MANTALKMMNDTLATSGALPAKFHEVAYALATKAADVDVIARLAHRPDAPASLLESYRQDKRIPVRVAYLTRTDLSGEKLMSELASEKRAGVLSEVLKASSSLEMRSAVEAVFLDKPTKTLAKLLVDSANLEVALAALTLLHADPLTSNLETACLKAAQRLALDEKMVDRLAAALTTGRFLLPVISSPHASAESVAHAIKASGRALAESLGGFNYRNLREWGIFVGMLDKLMDGDPDPAIVDAVLDIKQLDLSFDRNHLYDELLAVRGLADDGTMNLETRAGRLSAAMHSSDPAILDALIAAAAPASTYSQADSQLLGRLVLNPAITGAQIRRIFSERTFHPSASVTAKVASRCKGDLDALDAVYLKNLNHFTGDLGLSFYPDPVLGSRRLVSRTVADWNADSVARNPYAGNGAQSTLAQILRVKDFALDEVLDLIPWKMIDASRNWAARFDTLLVALAHKQTEILGDNFAAWETFAVLAEGFDGSVADLILAAKELS